MDSAQLRRATASDAPTIAHLLLAAFEEFRPLYTDGGFAATTPSAEIIATRLADGPGWLAFLGDKPVGTVSAVVRSDRLYIRSMAVLPAARGRQVGISLMREVGRFAVAESVRSMYLSTTPFLHRAIRLYEQLGFRRTEEEPHELCGTPLFTMEKHLDR